MIGKVAELIALLHPASRLTRGLKVLQDCLTGHRAEVICELTSLAAGMVKRFDLEGDAFYLLIQCYKPKRREEARFEAHEHHTDIQYLWSGREIIEVCDLRENRPMATYDAKGNVYFPLGDRVHQRFLLQAGNLAVLLPEEAHAPCLKPEGEEGGLVRKLVVKIRDAHLREGGEDVPLIAVGRGQEAPASTAELPSGLLRVN